MAATARSQARPVGRARRRATLPPRRALTPSPERRPGGPARPAGRPPPPRPRRRRAANRGLGTRFGNRIRAIRPAVLIDRLLRGRVWVALIALLLTGIVFLNVARLEVNGSIARMDARAAELRRDNAALRMRVARLGSSERIRRSAAGRGFVAAAPGEVGYLVTRPGDVAAAAGALEHWPSPRPSAARSTAGPGGLPSGGLTESPASEAEPDRGAGTATP